MSKSIALQIYEAVGEGYGYNGSQAQCIEVIETILRGTPQSDAEIATALLPDELISQHEIRVGLGDGHELPPWAVNMIERWRERQ